MRLVGFDGSPEVIAEIKTGGKTTQAEKQSTDRELVTSANADRYGVFGKK